jgi:hypothetical protein
MYTRSDNGRIIFQSRARTFKSQAAAPQATLYLDKGGVVFPLSNLMVVLHPYGEGLRVNRARARAVVRVTSNEHSPWTKNL